MIQRILRRPPVALFGLLTVSSAILAVWFAFEYDLLEDNDRPITWYVRNAVNRHTKVAYALGCGAALLAGIAITHFIIDADSEPPGR